MKTTFIIAVLAFALMLNSCGGNNEKTPAATEPVAQSAPAVEELSNDLYLEGNDQMQYNKNELKVAAGKTITLTFKHTGKLEKNAMGHNFVLLKQGTDINAFAQQALEAKESDYIPKSAPGEIIAFTKLIGGGESDTITFNIAEKGSYDFICSFPGHASMMKGKLIVE